MSWRSILGAAPAAKPYPQYSHNPQNSDCEGMGQGNEGGFEDIGNIGDSTSQFEVLSPVPAPSMPSGIPADLNDGLLRLHRTPMPQAFTPARWVGLKSDATALLVGHGDDLAAAGWTAADLFSVHPTAPETRQDYKGVVPVIHSRKVEGVTPESVTLRSADGSRTTIYRQPMQPGQVLLWELKP